MGRLKEFLINEQMKISGNWREKDHYDYLAWEHKLKNEKHEEEQRHRSLSHKQKSESENR